MVTGIWNHDKAIYYFADPIKTLNIFSAYWLIVYDKDTKRNTVKTPKKGQVQCLNLLIIPFCIFCADTVYIEAPWSKG